MTKDEFLEKVSSIDAKAGDNLKKIYKKAELDSKYAEKINITTSLGEGENAAETIGNLFIWDETEEGVEYWYNLKAKLEEANI